jgi:hypothetical protein
MIHGQEHAVVEWGNETDKGTNFLINFNILL